MNSDKNTRNSLPPLSEGEKKCLDAFRSVRKKLYPLAPSVQNVADELGVGKSTAGLWLKRLEAKGRVTRNGRQSRTLRLARRTA